VKASDAAQKGYVSFMVWIPKWLKDAVNIQCAKDSLRHNELVLHFLKKYTGVYDDPATIVRKEKIDGEDRPGD